MIGSPGVTHFVWMTQTTTRRLLSSSSVQSLLGLGLVVGQLEEGTYLLFKELTILQLVCITVGLENTLKIQGPAEVMPF